MLKQRVPLYEGALPYVYICYCEEDEALVFPIIGRMYNSGFRLWSAPAGGVPNDFRAIQHMNASSGVVMFMSKNMMAQISSGYPEKVAAARSPLLRAVVLLDELRPSNGAFALSAPDRVVYNIANSSAFWLYIDGSDYLERCRGPWPSKQLMLREPTFDDVADDDTVREEYAALSNIITGFASSEKEEIPEKKPLYANNSGYIPPEPDPLTYIPLGKVEAARTKHDRAYDEVIALLDTCADREKEVIINHPRPEDRHEPALPSLSRLRDAVPEKEPAQPPLFDMSDRPSAEIKAAEQQESASNEGSAQDSASAQSAEDAAARRALLDVPQPTRKADVVIEPTEQEVQQELDAAAELIAEAAELYSDESEMLIESALEQAVRAAEKSMVQVRVRKLNSVKISPVKVRAVEKAPAAPIRVISAKKTIKKIKLGDGHFENGLSFPANAVLPQGIDSVMSFERYVRDIARSAIAAREEEQSAAVMSEGENAVNTRKHKYSRTPSAPTAADNAENTVTKVSVKTVAQAETPLEKPIEASVERSAARKNKYPHNGAQISGLIAALRREQAARRAEKPSELLTPQDSAEAVPQQVVDAVSAYNRGELGASVTQTDAPNTVSVREDLHMKVIKLSDAITERSVNDLQAAINHFIEVEKPEPISVVPRICAYRR